MSLCPICGNELGKWSDDPLKTPKGISGVKGCSFIKPEHIIELQQARQQEEINCGIPESERTIFTPITGKKLITKQHIIELRKSTEKILIRSGIPLADFLSKDKNGNLLKSRTDWYDLLIRPNTLIKNVHIEDLRHYLTPLSIFEETWEGSYNLANSWNKTAAGYYYKQDAYNVTFKHTWDVFVEYFVYIRARQSNGQPAPDYCVGEGSYGRGNYLINNLSSKLNISAYLEAKACCFPDYSCYYNQSVVENWFLRVILRYSFPTGSFPTITPHTCFSIQDIPSEFEYYTTDSLGNDDYPTFGQPNIKNYFPANVNYHKISKITIIIFSLNFPLAYAGSGVTHCQCSSVNSDSHNFGVGLLKIEGLRY